MLRVTLCAVFAALLLIVGCGPDLGSAPVASKPDIQCLDIGDPERYIDIVDPVDGTLAQRGGCVCSTWSFHGMQHPIEVRVERCVNGVWHPVVDGVDVAGNDFTLGHVPVVPSACGTMLIRVTATDACQATVSHTHAVTVTPPVRRDPQQRD